VYIILGELVLILHELLEHYGEPYSEELGIDFRKEPFKWFLASMLFGGRISSSIAKKTYKAYEAAGLTSPEKIAASDEVTLIEIHGRGGYARYDEITAEYVLGVARILLESYDGRIEKLDKISENPGDLERKLQEFRGVGPVTVKIFLRELRGIWENADPQPTSIEILAAKHLGMIDYKEDVLGKFKAFWERNAIKGCEFRNFETALVRLGIELRRKKCIS
jgi:endonuclease III